MKRKLLKFNRYLKRTFDKLFVGFALILTIACAASGQNQSTLRGKITLRGEALRNTKVTLAQTNDRKRILTAATDQNGNYRFENVSPGTYQLTAETDRLDFGLTNKAALTIENNQAQTFDLELTAQANLGEVTIAAGIEQNVDEVSKSVSVISNQELQNRNEITIIDALRTIPGVRVQQSGGFGRLAAIKVRGLRNQDTAVLIDGQRFRDPTAITGDASPFLSDLQVTGIERLEILRGSGSSLYGTNAIGGVFNVLTDNYTSDFRGQLLGEAGGLGQIRGRANFSGSISERAFYNFGVSHTNFSKGIDGDDAARNTGGRVNLQANLNNYIQLTGRFRFSDAFVQLNSNPDTIGTLPATGIVPARALSRNVLRRFENSVPRSQLAVSDATFIPDANDPDASQASRFYNFNVALDGLINERANYRVSYQNLTTRRKNINGSAGLGFQPFGATSLGNFDGNIQTLAARSNVTARANLLTFGYEFEREKYGNDNFSYRGIIDYSAAPNSAVDAAQISNTFFVQDQISAFDRRLQLSGALRAQFFSLDRPSFSSNLAPYLDVPLGNPPTAYTADGSIAYFFRSTNTKLRAHVGNGYRVPSLYERFGTFYAAFVTPNRFLPYGNPEIEPERSIAADAGIDQTLNQNKVRLSATYFYTRLIDTIGFLSFARQDRFGRFSGYQNTGGGLARGAEFSAEMALTERTNVSASYTLTKSLQREAQIGGSGVLQTLGVPVHQFTVVATQRILDRLTLNFDFVTTSSYLGSIFSNTSFATRVFRFDGQRRGDLTASYEIPTSNDQVRVRLFGTIENIFNQDYYENGFRNPRAQGRGGLALNF